MRTSYSSIDTYLQCPQKYKFQEVDKIRAPKSREAIFGTAIHSALNFMFKNNPLFPTLDEVVDHFRQNWPGLEKLNQEAKQDSLKTFWTEKEEKVLFEDGVRLLKRFYEKNAPWNFTVLELESRFEVPIQDEKTGEVHILAGIIDRLDKTPEGYEIIDYKTGKKMPTQDSLKTNLQLSLYSLGIQKKWPHLNIEDIKLSLYFLKHEDKLSTKIDGEAAKKTKEHVLKTIADIQDHLQTGKEFEPMPSALCNWCSYRPICPAWRHLYKKMPSGEVQPTKEEIEKTIKDFLEIKKDVKTKEEKLDQLQEQIKDYMDKENLTRVFDEAGTISKKKNQRFEYDWTAVKTILANFGKWEEVLKADETKLKKIMGEIPESARTEIENARKVSKEYTTITTTFKREAGVENPAENMV
ncbi:MAG: PD-(D/E)XK nuclease family protein [bacterium]|nr:PD-(D/E)XK nuclease family protein [bacterium]